jgi:hypothetical protein
VALVQALPSPHVSLGVRLDYVKITKPVISSLIIEIEMQKL